MIREFKDSDILRIDKLGKSLFDNYDYNKKNELEKVIVYEIDNFVVGFMQYMKVYETIELLYLVVDENYRKKGIGTDLIKYLNGINGAERIILEVRETNTVARSFYSKNGFYVQREIKNYHSNGESAYSMEKVI